MSMTKRILKHALGNTFLAYRAPRTYLVAAPGPAYTIYTIAGGPVELVAMVGRITAAAVGATTLRVTVSGIAADAAGVAINGAVGTVVWTPLNIGGTILNAAAAPLTVATDTYMVASTVTGAIIATFGIGTSVTLEWGLLWRPLSPLSRVYAN